MEMSMLTGNGSFQLAPTIEGLMMATLRFPHSCWMSCSAKALVYVYVLGRSPNSFGVIKETSLSSIHLSASYKSRKLRESKKKEKKKKRGSTS